MSWNHRVFVTRLSCGFTFLRHPNPRLQELEARVEEAVRDSLYKARPTVITQPNNKLSRLLKQLLKEVPPEMRKVAAASLSASNALVENGAQAGDEGVTGLQVRATGGRRIASVSINTPNPSLVNRCLM